MMSQLLRRERGIVLAVAILTAITCSIAAYLVLFLAISQARQARFYHQRVRARYATEAAIVWIQQELRANPAYCPNWVNVPWNAAMEGYQPQVRVTNCGANNTHRIQARILNY